MVYYKFYHKTCDLVSGTIFAEKYKDLIKFVRDDKNCQKMF